MARGSQGEIRPLSEQTVQLLERLHAGETVWLKAQGGSMSPLIREGDVLEIVPSLRIRPGMVVLVNTPWGVRCHRVVSVENGQIVLRGDTLEAEERVLREQVVGTVRTVWRGKKVFSPYSGKWWLYGLLQTRAPQLMHGLRKVWRWSRRQRRHRM
ncbi:MAG: S24/S26 family peptidase [bacterium]|nr:S24/S26 family peptidase [bacterium]MCS7310531.1 S24/S26 family peptidase [Armatimonadota bacterium]MDW8104893.1 S24/S26 family peptidase [Armatimonadota bacterium]